ncbi:MAG: glycoside hydrolase family 172 protein [Anaerolineales bacterium]
MAFNGFGLHLGNLPRLSNTQTRSISAENKAGAKGAGGKAQLGSEISEAAADLGQGWKVSPCIEIKQQEVVEIANIGGPGVIQHMWFTVAEEFWRSLILRLYWDDEEQPSVLVPLGDFFCNGWNKACRVNSLPIVVNPNGGFNSYWEMPFHKNARISIENIGIKPVKYFFYQITYALMDIPDDCGTFHARWQRRNPLPKGDLFTIVDGVVGQGHYIGTYLAWGVNQTGWWGEGEIKFYIDGDDGFPTICGTGTEDYFGGAWAFVEGTGETQHYGTYSTPYLGFHQILQPDGFMQSQTRFGLYRWHVMDPIRFQSDLKVTIQDLGWRKAKQNRYLQRSDDIASTALWYQAEPHHLLPEMPSMDVLEVV